MQSSGPRPSSTRRWRGPPAPAAETVVVAKMTNWDTEDERDLRNLNDTTCGTCGEDMHYAHGFGWVCRACMDDR